MTGVTITGAGVRAGRGMAATITRGTAITDRTTMSYTTGVDVAVRESIAVAAMASTPVHIVALRRPRAPSERLQAQVAHGEAIVASALLRTLAAAPLVAVAVVEAPSVAAVVAAAEAVAAPSVLAVDAIASSEDIFY